MAAPMSWLGSGDVAAAIDKAAAQPKLASPSRRTVPVYRVVIPAADAASAGGPATVWLALFDSERETRVARGENGGRTLRIQQSS